MKTIEVDEELYRYIASHTQHIGESASDILRRMLKFTPGQQAVRAAPAAVAQSMQARAEPQAAPVAPAAPSVTAPAAAQQPRDKVRAMRELLLSDEYAEQNKAVNRFMLVLSTLYSLAPQEFAAATETLHGRTRTYFAGDEQTLLQGGNHTKPKPVPGTPYWVITNTNTGRKRSMIETIMQAMQFPVELTDKVCGTI
ncbi:replication initiation negative regulator SeqA [Chimaeribacter arupi]|jgi:negative modulator of initiation of replication|uniref:Negative modulator of initiation of replication n=3 Tax=Yersiniaceae TaxID=1903411 RepID=A0A2N5EQA7_9GAMM|nr:MULTISPECIES: replication initiation negative regulator SeqA [Yersiniaceae]MBS0968406.1 replication initiation negative regulator SeqA [Nissabacter archeti]MDV5139605.1 replication initiation negative regulator SeqA [Chimaeribacter arupi]PLR38192.1 replication initiation negative regulator SeqA [Chimaeribacter arupi]PLR38813.1 replication initiation negative regulator SeqA [Chimaeribacter californicus]PLR46379.1 replication initiation negative regulator SeqA [Chimaeribacter arupi]